MRHKRIYLNLCDVLNVGPSMTGGAGIAQSGSLTTGGVSATSSATSGAMLTGPIDGMAPTDAGLSGGTELLLGSGSMGGTEVLLPRGCRLALNPVWTLGDKTIKITAAEVREIQCGMCREKCKYAGGIPMTTESSKTGGITGDLANNAGACLEEIDREVLAGMVAFEVEYYKQALAAGWTERQAWKLLLSKKGRF